MGIALAAAAARRGADVTLIAANVALPEPAGVRRIDVETAAELAAAARAEFPDTHVLLMAAAPADFRASRRRPTDKLKREGVPGPPPGADRGHPRRPRRRPHRRARRSSASPPNTADDVERAREKLHRKGADLIVLNDVSDPAIGFESDENAVTLIDSASETTSRKLQGHIAEQILDRVDLSDRAERARVPRRADTQSCRAAGATLTGEGRRPPRQRPGYTDPKLFVPMQYREVGLAHFFFAPNQA